MDFQIELSLKRHNLQTEQGRADALAEFIPILAAIRESTRRDRYAQKFAYLSPLHNYDLGRAISSLLADAEMYARQSERRPLAPRSGVSAYAVCQWRAAAGTAAASHVSRPKPETVGRERRRAVAQHPRSDPQGRGRQTSGNGYGNGYGNKGYNNGWNKGRGRYKDGPASDPTPPSLDMPAHTGAEKAERQILRALFSPEWRVYILNNMQPALLVTPHGKRLYEIIARTPANLEGGIDPLPILHRAQSEEETAELPDSASLKFSYFIQEVLEDSTFIASNERLNEAAIADCIARLKKNRDEQEVRAKSAALYDMELLPPEQQRDAMNQYLAKMRALRGSPPGENAA